MSLQIHFYGRESYEDVYATLARIFPPKSSEDGTTTWLEIRPDGSTSVTFFAPDAPAVPVEPDEVAA